MSDEKRMRRIRIDLMTKEEKAIYDCMGLVEELGCDELLTDAVILLSEAKDKLSDFIDKQQE